MAKRILDDVDNSMLSPLIDVIFNALAAMFVIFIVYTLFTRPDKKQKLDLLAVDSIEGNFNQPFFFNIPTVGGESHKKYRLIEGILPKNLFLDSLNGLIIGSPQLESGLFPEDKRSYDIKIFASDLNSADSQSYQIILNPAYLSINPNIEIIDFLRQRKELPLARVGTSYEAVLGAEGGFGKYRWDLSNGNLPPGIVLKNGVISGTPKQKGQFEFEILLEDDLRNIKSNDGQQWSWRNTEIREKFELSVVDPIPLMKAGIAIDDGRVGKPFRGYLSINTGYYDKKIISYSNLPKGINFSTETGTLSGSPLESGQFEMKFEINSPFGDSVKVSKTVKIYPPKPKPEAPSLAINLEVNEKTIIPLPYRGLEEPIVWKILGRDSLPRGLRLESDRIIGRTLKEEEKSVKLEAKDASGKSLDQEIAFKIYRNYSTKPLELLNGDSIILSINTKYDFKYSAIGGTGNYNWNFSGDLPNGLQFTKDGIKGETAEIGRFPIKLELIDQQTREEVVRTVMLNVKASYRPTSTLQILAKKTFPIRTGLDYEFHFPALGGSGNYIWSFSGNLPDGFEFIRSGIKGKTEEIGKFPIKLRLSDQQTGEKEETEVVLDAREAYLDMSPLQILTEKIPIAQTGLDYEFHFAAMGGSGNYVWNFSGKLPDGLVFTDTGIFGNIETPVANDSFPLLVTLRDGTGKVIGPEHLLLRTYGQKTIQPLTEKPRKENIFKRINTWFGSKWLAGGSGVLLMAVFFWLAYIADENLWEWDPHRFFVILGIAILVFTVILFLN